MKRLILTGLSLVILISLGMVLNAQVSMATLEGISITKSGTFRVDESGMWVIDYTYTVKNTGIGGVSHTLSNIYIDDDKVGNNILTWPSLAPGVSHTFPVVTYHVKQSDITVDENGKDRVKNTATVYGTDLVADPNRTFSNSTSFSCMLPGATAPLPELPAGLLFGLGLCGLGGFVILKRRRRAVEAK